VESTAIVNGEEQPYSDIVSFTTPAGPTGVISGGASYCAGQSTTTSLSIAVTGTGPWSGTLSNGASFSGETSPISVSVSPTGTTTYTISTLSDANCIATAGDRTGSATVTVTAQPTWYLDADTDNYYTGDGIVQCTSPGAGYRTTGLSGGGDCNDGNAAINPGATEINFNNLDEDCDSSIFNGHAPVVTNVTTPSGTLPQMTSLIGCSVATNTAPFSATGASVLYRFRVTRTGPVAAGPVTIDSPSTVRSFAISSLAIAAHSSTYTVEATAVVNGEEQPYTGLSQTYTTPAAPVIALTTQTGSSSGVCSYTLSRINAYVYANNSTTYGANKFEFEVTRIVNGVADPSTPEIIFSTSPYFRLTQLTTLPINYDMVYRIRVRYGYDSYGSAVWSAYGSSCDVRTPALPTSIIAGCGSTLASIGAFIYGAGAAGGANLYEFKVTRVVRPGESPAPINPTVLEEVVSRTVQNFKLTMLTQLFVGLEKEYRVSVRYRINASGTQNWSNWSAPCSIYTPDFPITGVVESQCELPSIGLNQYIYADAVAGAALYRFLLELYLDIDDDNDEETDPVTVLAYSYYVDSPQKYVKLNQFPGLTGNEIYSISVAASLYGEFGPYSKDCLVRVPLPGTPAIPSRPANDLLAMPTEFAAMALPNPFANNFLIELTTESSSPVSIKVYDMVGRLIDAQESKASNLNSLAIGDQYPSGVYNVVVTQDEEVRTLRVVKR
jgi:hypothetical protein